MDTTLGAPEGARLLQSGDVQGAVTYLLELVSRNPSDAQAYGYLGVAQCRLGNTDAGIAALREATRLQPSDAGGYYNLAVALLQAGRSDEAAASLRQTLALNPSHANAQAALQRMAAVPAASAFVPPSAVVQAGMGQPSASFGGNYPQQAPPPHAAYGQSTYGQPSQTYPSQPQGGGMQYGGPMHAGPIAMEPPAGTRIARGLGWGFVYGQWWTLLNFVWRVLIYGHYRSEPLAAGLLLLAMVIGFGIAGAFVGFIIGAANASDTVGVVLGVIAGLCFFGLELLAGGSAFNLIFWFFTGRFVGRMICARVHAAVLR